MNSKRLYKFSLWAIASVSLFALLAYTFIELRHSCLPEVASSFEIETYPVLSTPLTLSNKHENVVKFKEPISRTTDVSLLIIEVADKLDPEYEPTSDTVDKIRLSNGRVVSLSVDAVTETGIKFKAKRLSFPERNSIDFQLISIPEDVAFVGLIINVDSPIKINKVVWMNTFNK